MPAEIRRRDVPMAIVYLHQLAMQGKRGTMTVMEGGRTCAHLPISEADTKQFPEILDEVEKVYIVYRVKEPNDVE